MDAHHVLLPLLSLGQLGCTVAQSSANASDPQNDPSVHVWPQSETVVDEILPTMQAPRGVLGAVYNDFSGRWMCEPSTSGVNCPLVNRPGGTLDGYSYSLDRGVSWTRVGTLPVPACTSSPCITFLDGNPWLVSTGARMLYSSMAEVTGDTTLRPSAIAVAASSDGITWSPFQIAARGTSGFWIDKPSMAMSGDHAVIAYQDSLGSNNWRDVSVATSDFWINGINIGWKSTRLYLPSIGGSYVDPIVKLASSTRAYLAYVVDNGAFTNIEIHVERLTRTKTITQLGVTYGDWYRDGVLFRLGPFSQTTAFVGAKGGWRDTIPIGFAVGGVNADRLYLVYRREESRPLDGRIVSQVHVRRCNLSIACQYVEQTNSNIGWFDTNLYSPSGRIFTGYQLQPNVTARVGTPDVAVTFYQQLSAGFTNLRDVYGNPLPDAPPDYRLSVLGVASTDSFGSFVGPFNLRAEVAPWLPCATSGQYWGDYVGSALLQTAPISTPFGPLPYTVTAHADSTGGCTFVGANGRNLFDQHVQAVVW